MTLFHHLTRIGRRSSGLTCNRPEWVCTPHTRIRPSRRHLGDIRVEKEDGYAVMYMSKKPVNSYSKDFQLEITDAILDLESDEQMQGLIITSTCPQIFSAGLDITQLHRRSLDELQELWRTFQDGWMVQYGSRLATVAAINGHCLAAGAVTALSCDYRIMARGPYTMAVNESRRDVVMPFWLTDLVRNTIGHRETERAIQLGLAYSNEDALRVGLVDELVDEDKLMDRAREEVKKWLEISSSTRWECKQQIRGPMLRSLKDRQLEDAMQVARQFHSERVQTNIENFLKSKKK